MQFNLKSDVDELLKNHKFLIDTKDLYLVGGCVRDMLFNKIFETTKEIRDIDYLVTNHTSSDLLNLGFEQVGASFPVYLEPNTKEEYALPRREKKTGIGYKDFEFETDDVTVLEDLSRRDITINSMCINVHSGDLIDPFKGIEHLVAKEIEMVSKRSFIEDPLRTLRACRFAAIFNATITDNTKETIFELVNQKDNIELRSIAKERLLLEFEKVLKIHQLDTFIDIIKDVSLDKILYPFFDDNLKNLGNIYNGNMEYTLAYVKYSSNNQFNLPVSSTVNELAKFIETQLSNLKSLTNTEMFNLINKTKLRHGDEDLLGFIEYLNDIKFINVDTKQLTKAIENYKKIDFTELSGTFKNDYKAMSAKALDMFKQFQEEKPKMREI